MLIGVPKEIFQGERRVAATPTTTERLIKLGHEVLIETQAGSAASFSDSSYKAVGGKIAQTALEVWEQAEVILKVRAPVETSATDSNELDLIREGTILICFIWPAQNGELIQTLAKKNVTTLAMDCVPRITRAQKMDALSSMANIAGYRAVIEAASHFGRFFTGQITAAGKIPPAKVLVIGAGVAGLAAIGTASALGAIVRAFDTRPAVAEQVKSMGGEFLMLEFEEDGTGEGGYAKTMSEEFIKAEMELFAKQAMEVDIIITTALIPGKPAPELITSGMVESMRDGSVIVDLAAPQGGNCALTEPDHIVKRHGVTIIGLTDLTSSVATQSSELFGTNLYHFLDELTSEAEVKIDTEDVVVRSALVTHMGDVTWPPPKIEQPSPVAPSEQVKAPHPELPDKDKSKSSWPAISGVLILALCGIVGWFSPAEFRQHFTVFVLSVFVGWKVIWSVTPSLHTPLMSVTNAISGIILIGALIQVAGSELNLPTILAIIGIFVATINVTGGFAVTQRMLKMFHK
jgi:NAD(P) transhydrogenase subunit alpha